MKSDAVNNRNDLYTFLCPVLQVYSYYDCPSRVKSREIFLAERCITK
jgi:hypothetical protein